MPQAIFKCIRLFEPKFKLTQPDITVVALLIFHELDLMWEHKRLKMVVWEQIKVLILLFFSKVKRAWFRSIFEFFVIAAKVLPIVYFVPLSFIVVDSLAKVVTIPFSILGVKRVDSLNPHLLKITVLLLLPRIDMDINIWRKILIRINPQILLFSLTASEQVTRKGIILISFIIAAHDVIRGVEVFTSLRLH